jgi:hypothetical protein
MNHETFSVYLRPLPWGEARRVTRVIFVANEAADPLTEAANSNPINSNAPSLPL